MSFESPFELLLLALLKKTVLPGGHALNCNPPNTLADDVLSLAL